MSLSYILVYIPWSGSLSSGGCYSMLWFVILLWLLFIQVSQYVIMNRIILNGSIGFCGLYNSHWFNIYYWLYFISMFHWRTMYNVRSIGSISFIGYINTTWIINIPWIISLKLVQYHTVVDFYVSWFYFDLWLLFYVSDQYCFIIIIFKWWFKCCNMVNIIEFGSSHI